MSPKNAFSDASQPSPDPFAGARLVLITPDPAFGEVHEMLISAERRDKVHPLGSMKELLSLRLGGESDTKRAYALSVGGKIAAVIYTHWSATSGKLPGNVEAILTEESTRLSSPPDTVTFYSISSYMRGAGERLISELHNHVISRHPGLVLTTLSPLRSLRKWLDSEGYPQEMSDDDLRAATRACLQDNQDPVQKFHLSNGAMIGAVHLNANHEESADALHGLGVMVNYVYPSDPAKLTENAARYKAGEVIFAPGFLQKSMPRIPAKAGIQP